jgi:low affinity Fe/Cu permease
MVFVLQNTQNKDSAALHLKLDEIITHLEGQRDEVAGVQVKSSEEIQALQRRPRRGGTIRHVAPPEAQMALVSARPQRCAG